MSWIRLDPTDGCQIQKTDPCLVISLDGLNHHISPSLLNPIRFSESKKIHLVEVLISEEATNLQDFRHFL
ncbi:type II toxin-antitoxin system PemK/MazF family toxin [Nitrospira sp. BLG_1]|uniref:type II toxin-antitoxin system PemK/MazF family toxin n=1 Tax=Nitrospira sp. BLG_1 TaxID=3395883 RepID=UPI0039BC4FB3